jgi:hypothetical protein
MWGSFILASYRWDARRALADALEEIASSRDTYGFASGGVYCFWRLEPREVLYIGRAVDLPERFAQHNGLRGRGHGTKRDQILSHFEQADELGYTVLVRAPNSQTFVARLRHQVESDFGPFDEEELWELEEEARSEADREIAHAEGIALRSYVLAHGVLPPWNRMGGELSHWGARMHRADDSGALMTGTTDMLLQARRTIQQLADDPTATQFESVLQLARSRAVARAMLSNEQLSDFAILRALDELDQELVGVDRERIRRAGYVLESCPLTVADLTPPVAALRRAWSEGRELPPWPQAPPLRER